MKHLWKNENKQLQSFERKLGLRFRKKALLLAALTHPSYRNESPKLELEDFERMEFFGDSILNLVISEKLYEIFPEADEGLLSQLRATLVSKKMLVRVADRLELAKHVVLGKSAQRQPRREKTKVFSDILEAVIAAIFLDQKLAKAKTFILRNFRDYFDSRFLKRVGISPKNRLQEWVQKKFKILPEYRFEMKDGYFLAWAVVAGKGKAMGEGQSKKEAEEKAARLLLKILKAKNK